MDMALIPNYLLSKIDKEIFSHADIDYYIKVLIDFLEINKYYDGIIYSKEKSSSLASYNTFTHKIRIFYNMFKIDGQLIAKEINHSNFILVTNITILHSILHEIIHIYQNALICEEDYDLLKLFYKELEYSRYCSDEDYAKYYGCFIFERDAEANALENCLRILRYLINDDMLFTYYLKELKDSIIKGYKINSSIIKSPHEVIFEEVFKEDTPKILLDDSYSKLKLGLPVNKNIYDSFIKDYESIIKKNCLQLK